jgi:hypothetical protein
MDTAKRSPNLRRPIIRFFNAAVLAVLIVTCKFPSEEQAKSILFCCAVPDHALPQPSGEFSMSTYITTVYGDKLFCFNHNYFCSSGDAISWDTIYSYGDIDPENVLTFKDSLWILNHGGAMLYASMDGRNWNGRSVPFGTRIGAGFVVHGEKLLLIGGSLIDSSNISRGAQNDVWSSGDGSHWERICASAPFAPRTDFGVASFDGKVWVVGGYITTNTINDVWCSEDGAQWQNIAAHAAFSARSNAPLVCYHGRLWLFGGESTNESSGNEVWSTLDGGQWRFEGKANYSERRNAAVEVFGDRIWVFGGRNNYSQLINDTWFHDDAITTCK